MKRTEQTEYKDPVMNWSPTGQENKLPAGAPVLTKEQQDDVLRRIANWKKRNF